MFYIQIKKAKYNSYWYSKKIGYIYMVSDCKDYADNYEIVIEGLYIDKDDCEVVLVNDFSGVF